MSNCPICGRPEATREDLENSRNNPGMKNYPDEGPFDWEPGKCWNKIGAVWGQSRHAATLNCYKVALDVERCLVAVFHTTCIVGGAVNGNSSQVEAAVNNMIRETRQTRLKGIAEGVPPDCSPIGGL